jgi:predicted secreted protein
MAITRAGIDVTSDDDAGFRTMLGEAGQKELNISVSGVTKDDVLRADAVNGNALQAYTLEFEDGSTVTGDFFLATYTETGTYNEAVTFEAEIQSSGTFTFTAGV